VDRFRVGVRALREDGDFVRDEEAAEDADAEAPDERRIVGRTVRCLLHAEGDRGECTARLLEREADAVVLDDDSHRAAGVGHDFHGHGAREIRLSQTARGDRVLAVLEKLADENFRSRRVDGLGEDGQNSAQIDEEVLRGNRRVRRVAGFGDGACGEIHGMWLFGRLTASVG
jgi:hypothetical protein